MPVDLGSNVCAPDPRTRPQKLWSRLGFGRARADRPDEAAGYIVSEVVVELNWADRVRSFASGELSLDVVTATDVPIRSAATLVDFRVLPPGWRAANRR